MKFFIRDLDLWTHLYCLPVVDFDHIETEAVHSFSRSQENAPRWIEMTANVHQNLQQNTKRHWLLHALLIKRLRHQLRISRIVTWSKYMVMVRLLISDGS